MEACKIKARHVQGFSTDQFGIVNALILFLNLALLGLLLITRQRLNRVEN